MRPSSVDTSEPAWVKRKMLSMKSSTSCFCTSRKYSAMVSADSATRSRVPGGSSIWPKTSAVCASTPDSRHLQDEVVALAGALTDAGEDRRATEVAGHPDDHLLDEHRLAHAGAAEQADLAALDVRGEQVEHLDAGLQHLGLRLQVGEGRRLAVDLPPVLDLELLARLEVEALADRVEDVALGDVADRHRDRPSRCRRTSAPRTRPSVGCIEMARTMLSPRCCATSRVSVLVPSARVTSTCSALKISGIASRGNSASTTGPTSTVCAGVTDPNSLIAVADRRLYVAKKSGRNAVVTSD